MSKMLASTKLKNNLLLLTELIGESKGAYTLEIGVRGRPKRRYYVLMQHEGPVEWMQID